MSTTANKLDVITAKDARFPDLLYGQARTREEREQIDRIVEEYPARFTVYLAELIRKSPFIARQFVPSPEEGNTIGSETPFEEGKHATGVYGLERLYRDRVLLTPHFDCPAYCRFCYKKSRVLRGQKAMSLDDIDRAMRYIAADAEIRGVLITGGDSMMNVETLFHVLDKLAAIESVHEIRVGTRSFLYNPALFTDGLAERFAKYNFIHPADPEKSRSLAFNVHFNHPHELTPEVVLACNRFISRGLLLRNQTVLLKGINDDVPTMTALIRALLRNRIIPYYMNHCMPVVGGDHLRCSVEKGQEILRHLCSESSTAIPHYVYAPSGGKVHVGPDTRFEYSYRDGKRYIVVKLVYTAQEFRTITGHELPPRHEVSADGFILAEYLDGEDAPAVTP